jgi:putative colanic acid biosynthesis UDP-glucose lipid carrier transferase
LRVQNDLWYLENWNIWLDIKILFLTVYTISKGDKQAY